MLNFCVKMGLTVLNVKTKGDEMSSSTFLGGGGSSVLDLVLKLEDEEETVDKKEVIPRVVSDHPPVAFEICMREAREEMGPSANKGVGGGAKLLWKDNNAIRFEVEFNQA